MRFFKKNKKQNMNWLLLQVATCHLICGLRFVTLQLNIRPPNSVQISNRIKSICNNGGAFQQSLRDNRSVCQTPRHLLNV